MSPSIVFQLSPYVICLPNTSVIDWLVSSETQVRPLLSTVSSCIPYQMPIKSEQMALTTKLPTFFHYLFYSEYLANSRAASSGSERILPNDFFYVCFGSFQLDGGRKFGGGISLWLINCFCFLICELVQQPLLSIHPALFLLVKFLELACK